ncbi:XTP/dITP diphosphatase [Candidatus Bathyarchaeota archaeon]|nr:XTP/dITP diphosphatase [Candidatus Bathyarchaeota archaeon]
MEGTELSKEKLVYFATRNFHKFEEIRLILREFGVVTEILNAKSLEIQSDDLEEIARTSVLNVVAIQRLPVMVEDAGLFIEVLNGFPGPYSSYVYRTIGLKGILKLLEKEDNRNAEFRSVIAFCRPGEEPKSFSGMVKGLISTSERGTYGFGFDPIFIPSGAGGRTFAEMATAEKNLYSHRAQAARRFAEWYMRQPNNV